MTSLDSPRFSFVSLTQSHFGSIWLNFAHFQNNVYVFWDILLIRSSPRRLDAGRGHSFFIEKENETFGSRCITCWSRCCRRCCPNWTAATVTSSRPRWATPRRPVDAASRRRRWRRRWGGRWLAKGRADWRRRGWSNGRGRSSADPSASNGTTSRGGGGGGGRGRGGGGGSAGGPASRRHRRRCRRRTDPASTSCRRANSSTGWSQKKTHSDVTDRKSSTKKNTSSLLFWKKRSTRQRRSHVSQNLQKRWFAAPVARGHERKTVPRNKCAKYLTWATTTVQTKRTNERRAQAGDDDWPMRFFSILFALLRQRAGRRWRGQRFDSCRVTTHHCFARQIKSWEIYRSSWIGRRTEFHLRSFFLRKKVHRLPSMAPPSQKRPRRS